MIWVGYALSVIGGVLVSASDSAWVEMPATVLLMISGALAARSDIRRTARRNRNAES